MCPGARGSLQKEGQLGLFNSRLPQEVSQELLYSLGIPGDLMARMTVSDCPGILSCHRERLLFKQL